MKKTIFISCLIILTVFISQAQEKKGIKGLFGVKVETSHDKFENTTTHRMTGNKVKIKGGIGNSIAKGVVGLFNRDLRMSIVTTRLQLENHISKDTISTLSVILKVSVEDDASFKVMDGESLFFLADDERIALSTSGAFNTDNWQLDGSNTKTHARYNITIVQLEKIINAKKVAFRIMQDSFYDGEAKARDKQESSFEGEFSKKNFKSWKSFYENYIVKNPTDK